MSGGGHTYPAEECRACRDARVRRVQSIIGGSLDAREGSLAGLIVDALFPRAAR